MDWLITLYLGFFIFGLVFTLATFLLGGLGQLGLHLGNAPAAHTSLHSGSSHPGGHIQSSETQVASSVNHPLQTNHNANHTFPVLNYLNFSALVVFVTWFGAAGYVVSWLGLIGVWSLLPALAVGVLGYVGVMMFLLKVLLPSDSAPMSASDDVLDGVVARVSSPIFEQGVGEVIYIKNGARRAAPARSLDGRFFPKDTKVVILKYEGGIVFVDDLDRLLTDAGAEKWAI